MALTDPEKRIILHLTRKARQQRWARWFALVGALIGMLGGGYAMWREASRAISSGTVSPVSATFIIPIAWSFGVLSATFFAYIVTHWGRDPRDQLLLKLAEIVERLPAGPDKEVIRNQ